MPDQRRPKKRILNYPSFQLETAWLQATARLPVQKEPDCRLQWIKGQLQPTPNQHLRIAMGLSSTAVPLLRCSSHLMRAAIEKKPAAAVHTLENLILRKNMMFGEAIKGKLVENCGKLLETQKF